MYLKFSNLKKNGIRRWSKKDNQYTIYANFVYYYYFHKTNISYLNNAKITQDSENIIKYFEIIFYINQISSFGCTGKTIFELKQG